MVKGVVRNPLFQIFLDPALPLLELCKTRWVARHTAYQHFYQCFKFMVITFEVIGSGQHQHILSDDFATATWDPESKNKANSLLPSITEFEFIVVFLIVYKFLSHLLGSQSSYKVLQLISFSDLYFRTVKVPYSWILCQEPVIGRVKRTPH